MRRHVKRHGKSVSIRYKIDARKMHAKNAEAYAKMMATLMPKGWKSIKKTWSKKATPKKP